MNFEKMILITISLWMALIPVMAFSQTGNYQTANRLLQQQKYEEAKTIFERLYEENPGAYIFYDRYIETLIHTKDFETALEVSRNQIERGNSPTQTSIRLGEIYHIMGERNRAIDLWLDLAEKNRNSIQIFYNIGSTMINRREFDAAIDLYREAREIAGNDDLFTNELANSLMQAGRYSEAMKEFFILITNSPDQMSYVQQSLMRMRDENIYKTAAIELEDYLLDLDTDHKAYSQLHQLLTWMLLETEQYKRALVVARQYERRVSGLNYSLYSVASQLNSVRQFELAAEGYRYYIENGTTSVRFRSMQQLADVYYDWAEFTQDFSIETYQKRMDLFEKAYELNRKLIEEAPRYDRLSDVIIKQIDLSLDVFFDIDKAEQWIKHLESLNSSDTISHELYAKGRFDLFKKDYTSARQSLTRANRSAEDSRLTEKIRYFLSESDFFSKDFEFAKIQLRSLERRETSYFANDALKLRIWIQRGLQADSTGALLDDFSDFIYELRVGNYERALETAKPVLEDTKHPLKDHAIVEFTSRAPVSNLISLYPFLTDQVKSNSSSPLKERMMWERARIAKIIYNSGLPEEQQAINEGDFVSQEDMTIDFNISEKELAEFYEQLILEFPGGFYAPFARRELQNLTEQNI